MSGLLFAYLFLVFPTHAQTFTPTQKQEIETVIRNYLITNPQVLQETFEALQKQEKENQAASRKQALQEHKNLLLSSKNHAVIGNPNGDVTLVEFFDYNCGYCRASQSDLKKLIEGDPKLRVVLKEYPVLGAGSIEASLIAAQLVGDPKYPAFHDALLATDHPVDKESTLAIAKKMGFDTANLEKGMQGDRARAVVQESYTLANALAINGTPGYVIGDQVFVGAVGYEKLKTSIDNMRKCGKAEC